MLDSFRKKLGVTSKLVNRTIFANFIIFILLFFNYRCQSKYDGIDGRFQAVAIDFDKNIFA